MDNSSINPNHAYAIAAGASAVSFLTQFDTFLHVVASLVVIVSGIYAIRNYIRGK